MDKPNAAFSIGPGINGKRERWERLACFPRQLNNMLNLMDKRKVVQIPLERVAPNPAQPRQVFREEELRGLAESLRQNGLLQPISVRKNGAGYELIAGERRLRAAKLLGWRSIAAIVNECDAGQSAVLAMTENMQRQNLGVFEEAEGLRRLIERWGVTQEEAALRLGKSQSALANKLRLLKLRDSERDAINRAGLTERHARALLRICDEKQREHALGVIIEKGWNVAKSEEYIDRLLQGEAAKPKKKRPTMVVKDVRIFMNTLRHAVDTMKKSGIAAQSRQNETEEYIEYMVRIPKAAAEAARLPAGSPISTFPVKRTG